MVNIGGALNLLDIRPMSDLTSGASGGTNVIGLPSKAPLYLREIISDSPVNVGIFHEVLRQALLLPYEHSDSIYLAIGMIRAWVLCPVRLPWCGIGRNWHLGFSFRHLGQAAPRISTKTHCEWWRGGRKGCNSRIFGAIRIATQLLSTHLHQIPLVYIRRSSINWLCGRSGIFTHLTQKDIVWRTLIGWNVSNGCTILSWCCTWALFHVGARDMVHRTSTVGIL